MTANRHVFTLGISARGLLVAGALYCVSLSVFAANAGNIGRAGIGRSGNSASVGPVTNSGGSTIPVSPTVGGWSQAGNYGVPPSATPGGTMNLTLKGDVVFSGVKYPFQAGYGTPWKDMAGEAGKVLGTLGCSLVTGGVVTLACMAAVPYIWDWVSKSGGRANPETGVFEREDKTTCTVAPCYEYRPSTALPDAPTFVDWSKQRITSCEAYGVRYVSYYQANGFPAHWTFRWVVSEANVCQGWRTQNPGGSEDLYTTSAFSQQARAPDSATWYPSSMDDIAPYMGLYNPDSRVVGEILSRGGEIPLGTPTVTGPSSIQGPETTRNNADGTREVSRTTYNFNTAGNTITNTSNVTNYNTYNSGGTLTSSRSETTTPAAADAQPSEDEDQTQCDKYPQTLGCAELDTPSVPIPKENKNVTFTEENPFGGGACPADVYTSLQTLGGLNVKVVDWATFCGMALPVRFLVLALASIMAFFIIMPGGVRE